MGTKMSRKNRPKSQRLGFESLEGRLLMAGNVSLGQRQQQRKFHCPR